MGLRCVNQVSLKGTLDCILPAKLSASVLLNGVSNAAGVTTRWIFEGEMSTFRCRNMQSCVAARILDVHVAPGDNQLVDGSVVPIARRVVQGRRPVLRLEVDVRPSVQQQPHHLSRAATMRRMSMKRAPTSILQLPGSKGLGAKRDEGPATSIPVGFQSISDRMP